MLIMFYYNTHMKQLISQTHLILSFLFLSGCTTNATVAPSQNKALNSVSNSNAQTKKSYWMQNQLDSFLQKKWNPTMKEDKEIQKKYGEKKEQEKTFTLQEFVDKQAAYEKTHPIDESSSNVKKLENMPVIGGSSSRR